jgi:hypothetical protein
MRDRPSAERLLEEARRALLQNLLPVLGAERRYGLLMIANAIAIATRELRDGAAVAEQERAALAAFLGKGAAAAGSAELEKTLAAAIRAGRNDGDAALHGLLSDSVARRLSITNPKALGK